MNAPFVLLRSPEDDFVLAMAGIVFVLDVGYFAVLVLRRRRTLVPSF